MHNRITVRKIDNGYVLEAYCEGDEQVKYVKTISKVPSILRRWFKEKDQEKTYSDMDREESEEKLEGDAVKIKIKMTK